MQLGVLPEPGGFNDQFAYWAKAMVILGSEFSAIDEEVREEARIRNGQR